MKESLLRQAAKLKQKNHDHKRWQKAVSILACVVVFCTVYALILPAVTMEKTAYCGKEEHTHTEDCYEKQLICGKEEGEGAHQHSDDCYREEQVLVCSLEESDGHQHTDACYTEEEVLTCTNTDPDHEHNEFDGCYTLEKKLTCGQEEGEGAHHHTAECYETQKVLACGQEENDGHHHTEECYKKELICQKEEHTHTLECYSNPEADVETETQWSRTFANVTLTGDWAKDLTAIAETQTGYTESDRNYTVNADNTTNGYTRYGQWAGMPYADWSATFTSFCLYYANVPESAVPRNTGCEGWNGSAVSSNGYTPKEGDLILLDGNQDGTTDHAGIVTSASADNVTAIVGDSDKAVRRNTYSTSNAIITGYVPMPQNPALAEDEPEETPTPEITEEPEPTVTPTPEVTKEPEPTATPEITPTPEVYLEQQTVIAELYTDFTYTEEEQSENAVIVSGNLPENGSIKAYPVSNINMEGKKVLCAWDITIFDANGNKWEPADGNVLSVKFQIPELTLDENRTSEIYYVPDENADQPEKLESQIMDDIVSFTAEHFSIYLLASDESQSNAISIQGVDFKSYIDKVTFERQIGGNGAWDSVGEDEVIDKKDKIRFNVGYTLPQGTLGDNKTIHYELPEALKNFTDNGKVYDTNDNEVGTYIIENGYVKITFDDEFAASNATSKIVGWVKLEGQAKDVISGTDEKTKIIFNDKISYEVTIKDDLNNKGDLSVTKSASNIDNENGTLTYTITVSSQNGTNTEVTLTDIMENININGTITVKDKSGNDVTSKYPMKEGQSGFTGTLPKMEAGDKYTIEYNAKVPDDASYSVTAKNKIKAESTRSDNSKLEPEQEITTDFNNKVEKKGKLSEDGKTITWTVTINPRKKDLNGWTLSDVLDGEPYYGKVQISPAVDGKSEITLPYTFGKGSDQTYTITYITDRNLTSSKVKNTAILTPAKGSDQKEESSGEIGVDAPNRYFKTGCGATGNTDGTITLKWNVSIEARTEIVAGWWWNDNVGSNNQWLTQAQIDELKTTLDNLQVGGSNLRNNYSLELTPQSPSDGKYTNVKVTSMIPIPADTNLSFVFSTTALKPTNKETYYNGMHFNNEWAQGRNEYIPSDSSVEKVDLNNEKGGSLTDHEYHEGALNENGTLKWRIKAVVPQRDADVIITENLPDNVTLTELKISTGQGMWVSSTPLKEGDNTVKYYSQSEKKDYFYTVYVERKLDKQIVVTVPKELIPDINDSAYNGWGMNSTIWLDVTAKINDDFMVWSKDSETSIKYAVFKNSVTITDSKNRDIGMDDQTQKITFDDNYNVIQKYALNDQHENNNVTYRIEVNPDAKTLLEEGGQLILTDILRYTSKAYSANTWESDAADQRVTLLPGSVNVYEKLGDQEIPLPKKDYSYTYKEEIESSTDSEKKYKNTLTVQIPDSKSLIIEYKYKITGKESKFSGTLSNTAKLEGISGKNSSNSTVNSFEIKSSDAGAHNEGIMLYKVDSNNYGKYLNGAEFDLYQYTNDGWQKVNTNPYESKKVSGIDGVVVFDEIQTGIAYKLVETKAPSGYKKTDADDYYFYVEKEPTIKPDGFNGIKLSQGSKIYYPNDVSYELPETGGTGTNRFTAVGLSLMAASLMCEYVMKRKRRERRGN